MIDAKGVLKSLVLDLRRELEGKFDAEGAWQPGDLERRLAAIGVRRDRAPVPVDELPHLSVHDREARRVVDAFLRSRETAGQNGNAAVADFVREAAYGWANRLIALRCMEARGLIDEVILQKESYGGRSLQHQRLARKEPEKCSGEDDGLFAVLFHEFARRTAELPLLFNPSASEVALRPSVPSLKRCVALLSGTDKGQDCATDDVFTAADALGWAYQFWNTEEKTRVFTAAAGKGPDRKKHKIEGADLAPATCFYTDSYMVSFLVQNSLGALWMGMRPTSKLAESWKYYVRDADRPPAAARQVCEITFLDPACGSGHFLIEAFDLFYAMYVEEGVTTQPAEICTSILEHNLYGIDIDERAVQFAAIALVMKAKEKAPNFVPRRVNLVSTNIRLPAGKADLELFLDKHPEDAPLKPAILAIFEGLAHADELGSLLQIDEPVEKELRTLKARYETAGSPAQQALWSEYEKPVQGKLPLGVATYEAWQERVLARIQEHFSAEAHGSDLGAAFFGEAAAKGISLVDLLARRYDVVAANPPYMGSKNMGAVLKRHVERHFTAGKRDLYAAFILRCLQLTTDGGRVAIVTQQSWMFLGSFLDLRALDARKAPRAFRGVLLDTALEVLAHLGRYAFSDIGNAAVAPVMFVLQRGRPTPQHRLWACRLTAPRVSEEQAALLRGATQGSGSPLVSRPVQTRFLAVPASPICYWLRERFFDLLGGPTLGDVASVCQGLATADDPRFVRFTWEVSPDGWSLPTEARRWVPFEKGGGYGKWFGHQFWAVDWERGGARIRSTPGPRVQNEQHYFKAGSTYSYMASGSVGLRAMAEGTITCDLSAGVFPRQTMSSLAAVLNARLSSYIVRSITPKTQLRESYVSRIPLPERTPTELSGAEESCLALKRYLVALDPAERSFGIIPVASGSLAEALRRAVDDAEGVAAVLHTVEGHSEREVFAGYGIDGADLQAVLDETGTPAGWLPLVAGYDAMPQLPKGLEIPVRSLTRLSCEPRRTLSADEHARVAHRLRALYEAGPGAKVEDDAVATDDDDDDESESESPASGARVPIPVETYLEELSQKIELHPISVYWLLRELRDKNLAVCQSEFRRFAADYVSVLVLRLLGHRWPREVGAGVPAPPWVDGDGIIPLSDGTGERALLARVRDRIAEDFRADHALAIERELEEVFGRPLGTWLSTEFFKSHIVQFKKRPIAWQIESTPGIGTKRQGLRSVRKAPAFSCVVYYHRLDADLLPKLRTQYLGPLRASFQTELGGLETTKNRSADQDARRLELEDKLDELKSFDARVERVIVEGFLSSTFDFGANEPNDKWTSRDGRTPAPASRDVLMAQESRYDPDLNDGVRVNIAPLQRAGLLAANVLATKDVEQAIADRAEWRGDERRWCRDGKLPRPGWWVTTAEGAKV